MSMSGSFIAYDSEPSILFVKLSFSREGNHEISRERRKQMAPNAHGNNNEALLLTTITAKLLSVAYCKLERYNATQAILVSTQYHS
jgi:hypothetical protein